MVTQKIGTLIINDSQDMWDSMHEDIRGVWWIGGHCVNSYKLLQFSMEASLYNGVVHLNVKMVLLERECFKAALEYIMKT